MVVEILQLISLLTLLSQDSEKVTTEKFKLIYFLKTEVTGLILLITVEVISPSESERNLEKEKVSVGF